jgi:pyruvate ferredoxin oxidoreductase alpha subunit
MPTVYTEAKMSAEAVLRDAYGPIVECFDDFGKKFGRRYKPVETYRTEDADIIFVTMGGISETAMTWIDQKREKGEKVGLVRFRMWRPLPMDDFKKAVKGAKTLVVLDRHFSPGGAGGPVAQEIKYMMYGNDNHVPIVEFVVGLGGRDVTFEDFDKMYAKAVPVLKGEPAPKFELLQVRGGHYGEV